MENDNKENRDTQTTSECEMIKGQRESESCLFEIEDNEEAGDDWLIARKRKLQKGTKEALELPFNFKPHRI